MRAYRELLDPQHPLAPNLLHGADWGPELRVQARLLAVELHARTGDRREPFHLCEQVIEEPESSQLAVAHYIQADALLKCDRSVDGTVLDLLELGRAEPSVLERLPRLDQVGGAQQRADRVCSIGGRHRTSLRDVPRQPSAARGMILSCSPGG